MSAENTAAVPTVKLPQAVLRQKDRVNEIIKERMQENLKTDTPSGTQTVTDPNSPTELKDTPAKKEEPSQVTSSEIVEDKTKTVEYWEHRFKTSQGMFEAEKTRLRSDNENLRAEQSELKKKFRELESRVKTAERSVPKEIDLKRHLTDEQIDAYGPDVLKAVVKVASNTADEAVDRKLEEEIDSRVRPVKEELDAMRAANTAQKEGVFWDTVEDKVPDWVTINGDQRFLEWLNQKDPISGFVRQSLLTQAQMAFDSERVVALFQAFKQSSPASKVQPSVQHRVVPDPVGQTGAVTQQIPEAPSITRAEIKRFFDDCKLGRYRSRPQEKADFEKRLRAAQLAGNIR